MLDKTLKPETFEKTIYDTWLKCNCFETKDTNKPSFTIMMPPPNVTGVLHLGHALNYTLQDVLVRFKRQTGFDVLWQPGTDHAGIATQIVVEKQLKEEGKTRHDLGREKFIERVWQWKEQSGNQIVHQMQRLGISPDWKRQRFTMDDGLNEAVKEVFVQLYKDGLIYKDKRLVNWDPILQTAISDLEVTNVDVKGKLYHIVYPVAESDEALVIATTRPETLFGDTAVAVHPEDERYKHLIGKVIKQPITNRFILIIADDYVDKDFGTGCLKVTPAHDFNDFALGKKHHLEMLNILNPDGTLNENTPQEFHGLKSDKARELTLKMLEEQGFLKEITPLSQSIPISTRTEVVVEPYLTDQWFVNTEPLAKKALEAVETKKTQFFPESWQNTYFEWLRNIQPWCISRQIWWGHQIPAWYGPDKKVFVAKSHEEALLEAKEHYGYAHITLTQDQDVLDTWFSSALWPFSTLGWPERSSDLKKYYPTSVLVTGFDIIFFWVARMMMMGIYTQDEIPFETVYIHALVRDEKGQKMSKSRGNVLDPLDIIDTYGADALRFTLSMLAVPGRDVKIGPSRVENYRNFLTKIWNAARFLQMNDISFDASFEPTKVKLSLSKWIISHTAKLASNVYKFLEDYRFDLAANEIYHFTWGLYCDYFLEFLKPILNGDNEDAKEEVKKCAAWVFIELLKIIQPFTPFLSEHLWETFTDTKLLCDHDWPTYGRQTIDEKFMFSEETLEIDALMDLINNIRSLRAEFKISPSIMLTLKTSHDLVSKPLYDALLKRMGRLASLQVVPSYSPIKGDLLMTVSQKSYYLQLGEAVDLEKEKDRLSKEIQKIQKDIEATNARLNNPDFMNRAKSEIITEMRERLLNLSEDLSHKENALKGL